MVSRCPYCACSAAHGSQSPETTAVATVFVHRYGYGESVGAALSEMGATTLSFALCFIYLLFSLFTGGDWRR